MNDREYPEGKHSPMIFDPLAPLKCRFGHGTMWRRGCRGDTAGRHERKRSYIIRGPLNDVPLTGPSSGKGPAIPPQNRHVENGRNHVGPRRSKPSGRKSTKDKNSTVRIVPPGAVFCLYCSAGNHRWILTFSPSRHRKRRNAPQPLFGPKFASLRRFCLIPSLSFRRRPIFSSLFPSYSATFFFLVKVH